MNKTFCAFPWVHLHPNPKGTVSLCCDTEMVKIVGNLKDNSLDEIANNDIMNETRSKMIKGLPVQGCEYCYEKEKGNVKSVRNLINEVYQDQFEKFVEITNEDGSLKVPWKMKHFNLRVTNLCNFSCRSCYFGFSSVIAQESGIKNFVVNISDARPTFFTEIFKHLPYAESLTFVGGESTLIDEYWDIMDELIRLKNTNIKLFYFTNLSKIEHNGKSLIKYLQHFPNHRLMLSLDGYGERLELLRNGSNWERTLFNLTQVYNAKLNYTIFPTISAINAYHIPDFEKFLIENNFLQTAKMEHNTVVRPRMLNSKILPLSYKNHIKEKVEIHKIFLKENNYEYIADQWDNFLKFMFDDDYSYMLPEFVKYNNDLDTIRNQELYKTYPELEMVKAYYESKVLSQNT